MIAKSLSERCTFESRIAGVGCVDSRSVLCEFGPLGYTFALDIASSASSWYWVGLSKI